jgi:type II secretion system protein J
MTSLSKRTPRGFSLIEVMLYSSLSSSITAKETVEGTSNRYHLARQAMSRMVDEISMSYLSAHQNQQDPRRKYVFKGERDQLEFISFGYMPRVQDAKRSDQRELTYSLGTDERSGEEAIIRREQPNPDIETEDGGREQTLLPYVTELEFQYWDQGSEDWKDEWDSEEAATLNRLPQRVRIQFTMVMNPDTEEEQTFYTQSRIWLTAPINFQ